MSRKISSLAFLAGLLIWAFGAPTRLPLLTLLAIAVHESGHLCAAWLLGLKPTGVTADTLGIRLFFGKQILSYRQEMWLAAAGPLFNALSALPFVFTRHAESSFFVAASTALLLLNLLPITDFDGGRILSCLLSRLLPATLAERILYFTSFFSLFVLWCASVYLILRTDSNLSLFFFSAAVFFRIFLQKNAP